MANIFMNDELKPGKIIVVGAGLAGLVATAAIYEAGGSVLLLEKSSSILESSGNAAQTVSGINGCLSMFQSSQAIEDSVEAFMEDIVKNGGPKSLLMETLCEHSGPVVDWLSRRFDLNFVLTRSGGHNRARTHKTRDKHTGATIVKSIARKIIQMQQQNPNRIEILTNCRATRLVMTGSKITGVECIQNSSDVRSFSSDAVVLATGGYGADFNSSSSFLSIYRPDLVKLATCSSLGSTGDGVRMAEEIGVKPVDMVYVEVNPTGLVDPKDLTNRVKLCASESLRGDGGIMINRFGDRFVNEVAKRDELSTIMVKQAEEGKGSFRIILNSKTANQLSKYIAEYLERGLMQTYMNGAALCQDMGIDPDKLAAVFAKYNQASVAAKENNVTDEFGKRHFRNTPIEMDDQLTVALIEPVIGYCSGGVPIDDRGRVVVGGKSSNVVSNLFAAGEVTGGVHFGGNPLVGNTLLDCAVFGKISGTEAARLVYGHEYVERRINPALVLADLKDTLERLHEEVNLLETERIDSLTELADLERVAAKEKTEIEKFTKNLNKKYPDLRVAELVVDWTSPESVAAYQNGLVDISRKCGQKLSEIELSLKETNADIQTVETHVASAKNTIDQLTKHNMQQKAKIDALAKELQEKLDSSTVLREINQIEKQLSEYKVLIAETEERKAKIDREFSLWMKENSAELDQIQKKKEELFVMMGIEKIENKKEIELLKSALQKYLNRVEAEKELSARASELASDPEFPFFHKPLRLPPPPSVLNG